MEKIPKKPGRPKLDDLLRTSFVRDHEAIFKDFTEGKSNAKISREWNVNQRNVAVWRKHWINTLEFSDEPIVIKALKDDVKNRIPTPSVTSALEHRKNLAVASRQLSSIDDMRAKGLVLINKLMDRMGEVMDTMPPKDLGKLAVALSAIMPYVATKKEAAIDSEGSIEDRRLAFVQNIFNVYEKMPKTNILTLNTDENDCETIEPEGDPEE